MYFLVWVIYLYNLSYMVIDSLCNLSYLEVVFLNCYYYIYFCLVDFGIFSCIGRMIYLVLCAFEVYSDCLDVFVYIRKSVSVSSAIFTPFFERWFAFKFWMFFVDI